MGFGQLICQAAYVRYCWLSFLEIMLPINLLTDVYQCILSKMTILVNSVNWVAMTDFYSLFYLSVETLHMVRNFYENSSRTRLITPNSQVAIRYTYGFSAFCLACDNTRNSFWSEQHISFFNGNKFNFPLTLPINYANWIHFMQLFLCASCMPLILIDFFFQAKRVSFRFNF